jgi:hypothetical protein
MLVQKLFCIALAFTLFVKAHRIALHYFHIALFAHFKTFSTFLVNISRLMHQKVVRSARKMRKICKKVRNAMRKWNQNWHRIASHYCNKIFSHFPIFLHRIRIALPSLAVM